MEIRTAAEADYAWLRKNEIHVNDDWIRRCISHDEYLVCKYGSSLAGFIRYSHFWGEIPYMDMIWVVEKHRYKGIGTALFSVWQSRMKDNNAKILMTSSVLNENEPQEWHRRNGFSESGQLTFGQFDPNPEIFLVKNL